MEKTKLIKSAAGKVLVVQPYGIGDTLFMLPLLKALKQQKPASKIDVICGPRTKTLLRCSPYVDDIFVIDKDKWKSQSKFKNLLEKWELFMELRKRRYSLFIDTSMQPEYAFWARFLLWIPLNIGFNFKNRNKFLNFSVSLPKEGFSGKHVIEYYNDLARLIGLEISDKRPQLNIPAEVILRAKDLLLSCGVTASNFMVLSPGGGTTWGQDAFFKQWPTDYFAELVNLIKDRMEIREVVVLGVKEEKPLGEYLKKNISLNVFNLCGKSSILEAAAIIKLSSLFIGNDGGLLHLAVSQNTPVIGFYGPVDLKTYGPYPPDPGSVAIAKNLSCQPCYQSFRYNSQCKDMACLKTLTPQEALAYLDQPDFFKKSVPRKD